MRQRVVGCGELRCGGAGRKWARHRVCLLIVLLAVACAGEPPGETGETTEQSWNGTVSTQGNETTVVTDSGSVWGGTARLVEELSIGVQAGEAPYMFGRIWGIAAADDIYVLDAQVPALRVYDREGRHVRDIGARGQGPGEFDRPDGLAIGPGGRLFVRVFSLQRINVYDASGEYLHAISGDTRFYQGGALRVVGDGVVYARTRDAYIGMASDGSTVEPIPFPTYDREPLTVRTAGIPGQMSPTNAVVPFGPRATQTLAPDGSLISGYSDRYRFIVARRDGSILVIERVTAPVPVAGDERAWHEQSFRDRLANFGSVEGEFPELPEQKPYFSRLLATHDGNVWVVRPGPGRQTQDCPMPGPQSEAAESESCWRDTLTVDAFELDGGRYLGEVELPEGMVLNPQPHIEGDRVFSVFEDADGTIMVKGYRLELPEGTGS